jgi:primase-polymerase (primpol)-like protein
MIASAAEQVIPTRPIAPTPTFENAPLYLVDKKNWVLWRYEWKGTKWTKPPCKVDGTYASPNDLDTCASFEEVKTAYEQGGFDGIGFVFDGQDNLIGIDLDHVIDSNGTKEWAKKVLDNLNSYTEYSPSGKGAHCLAFSPPILDKARRKKGDIEIFQSKAFFTFTGNLMEGYPTTIEKRTDEIRAVYEAYFASSDEEDSIPQGERENEETGEDEILHLDDAEVIRIAERLSGNKFKQLMAGQWEDLQYKSSSEARMALLNMLAYYCDGKIQIDRIFRKSGIFHLCSDKWERLAEDEIGKAMVGCKGHYRSSSETKADHPRIVVNDRNLCEVVNESLDALKEINNPPKIFQRGRILCRVIRDDDSLLAIEQLNEASLKLLMSEAAEYIQTQKKAEKVVFPPRDIVQGILSLEDLPFPRIKGITNVPIVRLDGSICTNPGYDPLSEYYYDGNLNLTLPENSTKEDAKAAAKYILDEVLVDFPFDDAGRANALAGMLTPVIRPYIRGLIPLLVINKSTPGTGASLYMDCVYLIAEGMPANMSSLPKNEEEIRKQITSALFKGTRLICYDNQDDEVQSGTLSRALTSTIWEDRFLGQTKMLSLRQQACWYITGNNVILGGDLPRRCYECYMDAKHPNPCTRTGFKHEYLKEWVKDHRSELVNALLTMTKAWVNAGKPAGKSGKTIGSFEDWVKVIDGILTFAGVKGFLGNLNYEQIDTDAGEWGAFIVALYKATKDKSFTSKDLINLIGKNSDLENSLPSEIMESKNKPGFAKIFGSAFMKKKNRRYEAGEDHPGMDYVIVSFKDKHTKTNCYKIEFVERGQRTLM